MGVRRVLVLIILVVLAAAMPVMVSAQQTQNLLGAQTESAPTHPDLAQLKAPRPAWYTDDLHERVMAAGPRGVDVKVEPTNGNDPEAMTAINCAGVSPETTSPGVSAGACMVSPNGCTMNFIFADTSGNKYIGTAGHCVNQVGEPVTIQVQSGAGISTVAYIGDVVKFVNRGIGADFALVRINPGFAISPALPVLGPAGLGPQGLVCGDNFGSPIRHYGHGYIFEVSQGYPRAGVVINDDTLVSHPTTGYNWMGHGLPGDSGSGVVHADQRAIGNLTHGIRIFGIPFPSPIFGMRIEAIMDYLGSSYFLVNADGTTSEGCSGGGGGPGPVNQAPTASYTVQFPGKQGGTTGNFNGTGSSDSDGTIVSYSWNFGDGATGSGAKISHTYTSAGSYQASLTVTDDDGASDTQTRTITCQTKGKNVRCSAN